MTESEWLASEDPAAMLDLRLAGPDVSWTGPSPRKMRLFACACVRQCWPLLADERSRRAVEVAERYADGTATSLDIGQANMNAAHAVIHLRGDERESPATNRPWMTAVAAQWTCHINLPEAAVQVCRFLVEIVPPAAQAALLRDVIGNPFRAVKVGHVVRCPADMSAAALDSGAGEEWVRPPYLTPTVLALAAAAYDSREGAACESCGGRPKQVRFRGPGATNPYHWDCDACAGTGRTGTGLLEADRLAVLADSLEDGGCTDGDLLRHLRGEERCPSCVAILSPTSGGCWPCRLCGAADWDHCGWLPLAGPHCLGCWSLDLILGRE